MHSDDVYEDVYEEFGPYLLVKALGKGGMGVVYLARNRQKQLMALKRLRPDAAWIDTFEERFAHEGELAKMLSHPNLVRTYDVGTIDGRPYIAWELIFGQDVRAISDLLLEQGRGAPTAVAIRVLQDTLTALSYVHSFKDENDRSLGLIHRDVTPGNIMLGYDGRTRLTDLGLAKSKLTEEMMLTAEGAIMGTPAYIAPELVKGGAASPGSDIYGLGAVTYRLLTGQAPYEGPPNKVLAQILQSQPPSVSTLRPDLPSWFVGVIERMMMRSPKIRPSSARALRDELTTTAQREGLLIEDEPLGAWLRELLGETYKFQASELKRALAIEHVPKRKRSSTRVLGADTQKDPEEPSAPKSPRANVQVLASSDAPTHATASDGAANIDPIIDPNIDRFGGPTRPSSHAANAPTADSNLLPPQDHDILHEPTLGDGGDDRVITKPQSAALDDDEFDVSDPTAVAAIDSTVVRLDPPTLYDDAKTNIEEVGLEPVKVSARVPSRTVSQALAPPASELSAPEPSGAEVSAQHGISPPAIVRPVMDSDSRPGHSVSDSASVSISAISEAPLWSGNDGLEETPSKKLGPFLAFGALLIVLGIGGAMFVKSEAGEGMGVSVLIGLVTIAGLGGGALITHRNNQQRLEERRWALLERLGNVRKSLVLTPDIEHSQDTEMLLAEAKASIASGRLTKAQAVLQDLEVIALSRSRPKDRA